MKGIKCIACLDGFVSFGSIYIILVYLNTKKNGCLIVFWAKQLKSTKISSKFLSQNKGWYPWFAEGCLLTNTSPRHVCIRSILYFHNIIHHSSLGDTLATMASASTNRTCKLEIRQSFVLSTKLWFSKESFSSWSIVKQLIIL